MITLAIENNERTLVSGKVDHEREPQVYEVTGEHQAILAIKDYAYQVGDRMKVTVTEPEQYLMVQLDETLAPTMIYLKGTSWEYEIPFGENARKAGVETSFLSKRHHLMVRKAHPFEINHYQNLSVNTHDQKMASGAYPHALANVETRDEAVFFAKNAIDGKYGNVSHGSYPFASWGINQQADAALTIDFGRQVMVDWVRVLFRGDYPHDSYWTSITLVFSDGEELVVPTAKSLDFQEIKFPMKETTTITVKNLQKADDESPFPALTQIEVFGFNK